MIDLSTAPELFYTIYTKAGKEEIAALNLQKQGATVFAPYTRNKRYEPRPAFPRYIFAAFDLDSMFTRVRNTRGVSNLVRFGDGFATVARDTLQTVVDHSPKDFVDFTALKDSPKFRYAIDEIVEITFGSLYGQQAKIVGIDDRLREYILEPQLESAKDNFNSIRFLPSAHRFKMPERHLSAV